MAGPICTAATARIALFVFNFVFWVSRTFEKKMEEKMETANATVCYYFAVVLHTCINHTAKF